MTQGRFVSYLCLSTHRQGLEAQRKAVEAFLRKRNGARLVAEVVEVDSVKHPKLASALALCRIHGATLLLARVDLRALHTLRALRALDLDSQGVAFVCTDKKVSKSKLPLLIAKCEAANEKANAARSAIIEEQKARGTYWKPNNLKNQTLGRERGRATKTRAARARAADLKPHIEELRAEGATTLWQFAHGLNARKISASKGGSWNPMQVKRILARLGESIQKREGAPRGRPVGSKTRGVTKTKEEARAARVRAKAKAKAAEAAATEAATEALLEELRASS